MEESDDDDDEEEQHRAATRMQAVQRGRLARQDLEEQQWAATRVQAVQRGRRTRASRRAEAEAAGAYKTGGEDMISEISKGRVDVVSAVIPVVLGRNP